ncbi:MAG TPA: hypothetical protein VFN48_05515 [Solirubrobacteraceae bacterium]|nr:hypothetical protein [Solirubrobacteraceae bacterium]
MTALADFSVARRPENRAARTLVAPRTRSFSKDEIIAAIHRWQREYGECPKMVDWEPARARRLGQEWRAERFETGHWPSAKVVCGQFGNFNSAIAAAGLTPRRTPSRQRPNLSGPEAVLGALVEWTRRYGDVPTMADWDPARARRLDQEWRIARYHQGDWPSAASVRFHFGSFAKAIAAAGLIPRSPGVHHDARQSERQLNRLAASKAGRPPATGPEQLAAHVRAVARARGSQDPVAVHAALVDLAGIALAWAEAFSAE